MSKRDYYEVLGIAGSATPDEIKKAYRRAAQKHHPDRNNGDKNSEEKFKEAKEAYEVLSDPSNRARYDRFGINEPGEPHRHHAGFDDVMRAARGAFNQGNNGIHQQIGVPIGIMLNGGNIEVNILVPVSGGQYGTIRLAAVVVTLEIKKDTAPGTTINKEIEGNTIALTITPQSSDGFMAHGIDIVKKIDINVLEAMSGTTVSFKHLDGTKLSGNIPHGTANGTPLRIQGRGLAHPMGGRGDLIVVVNHIMPVLNTEQIKLVKELVEKLK